MPLEIRELVIKAVVSDDAQGGNGGGTAANDQSATDEIVKRCVEEVMAILNAQKER